MRIDRSRAGGRAAGPGANALIAIAAGLALGLSGCAVVPPAQLASPTASATVQPTVTTSPTATGTTTVPATPGATPTISGSATASPSGSPSASATTPTVSPSASSAPAEVKATGSMLTFSNLVSDQLVGTCQTTKTGQGFALSDPVNDFYGTVGLAVALNAGRNAVEGVRADFGEDFEGTTRKLVYPDTGTSATVSASGSTYTVKGKLRMYEGNSKSGSLVPFTITVKCASSNW